jgi:hypothetical protein
MVVVKGLGGSTIPLPIPQPLADLLAGQLEEVGTAQGSLPAGQAPAHDEVEAQAEDLLDLQLKIRMLFEHLLKVGGDGIQALDCGAIRRRGGGLERAVRAEQGQDGRGVVPVVGGVQLQHCAGAGFDAGQFGRAHGRVSSWSGMSIIA